LTQLRHWRVARMLYSHSAQGRVIVAKLPAGNYGR
jgi:hypothetical protein